MIYDQGFNLEFSDLSFYAFSKYEIKENADKKKGYNSLCFSTCVGWYRNRDSTKWGCYQAFKLNEDPNQITAYNTKVDDAVVEPKPKEKNSHQFDNIEINSIFHESNHTFDGSIIHNSYKIKNIHESTNNKDNNELRQMDQEIQNEMKDMEHSDIDSKIFFGGDEGQLDKSFLNSDNHNKQRSSSKRIKKKLKIRKTMSSDISSFHSNFLQHPYLLHEQLNFKNHEFYVKQINKLDKSWTAAVYPNFAQMSLKELNRFAGGKKSAYSRRIKKIENKIFEEDVSMFPKNFHWKSLLRQSGSQGQCGSCYAYATIRMVEARLKLKFDHEVKLSVQHPLDCSIYNQGCDGGYPFLVMKYANEFELLPENCKPYLVFLQ